MNILVFDVETESLDLFAKDIVGYAYKINDGEILWAKDISIIKDMLTSKDWLKVGHNLKFEYHKLLNYGIAICEPLFDTMIGTWLINKGIEKIESTGDFTYTYGLKALASKYFDYVEPTSFKDLTKIYGKKEGRKTVPCKTSEIPEHELSTYCKRDVEMTDKLYKLIINDRLYAQTKQVFEKIEMPFIKCLVTMERNGIKLDKQHLTELKHTWQNELAMVEAELEKFI